MEPTETNFPPRVHSAACLVLGIRPSSRGRMPSAQPEFPQTPMLAGRRSGHAGVMARSCGVRRRRAPKCAAQRPFRLRGWPPRSRHQIACQVTASSPLPHRDSEKGPTRWTLCSIPNSIGNQYLVSILCSGPPHVSLVSRLHGYASSRASLVPAHSRPCESVYFGSLRERKFFFPVFTGTRQRRLRLCALCARPRPLRR